jgi:limonene-1,2-epoxide hydrolase
VPGIRPGNHGDAHGATLPQRFTTTLATMTDQASRVLSDVDNARTVETFLYALQDEDYDTVDAAFADTIAWQNVGFAPTLQGRQRIMKILRSGQGRVGFEVKIHRIAADGNAVLTERTDALVIGPLRVQFWVCGVFEVHAGRITLWRDYFDFWDIAKATLRGLAATVVPSLRQSL